MTRIEELEQTLERLQQEGLELDSTADDGFLLWRVVGTLLQAEMRLEELKILDRLMSHLENGQVAVIVTRR